MEIGCNTHLLLLSDINYLLNHKMQLEEGERTTLRLSANQAEMAGFLSVEEGCVYDLSFSRKLDVYYVKTVRTHVQTGATWTARSVSGNREEIEDIYLLFS